MKTYRTGTIYKLDPGEVCELPAHVISSIVDALSEYEKRLILLDLAIDAPGDFQMAVMNQQRFRDRLRAMRAAG